MVPSIRLALVIDYSKYRLDIPPYPGMRIENSNKAIAKQSEGERMTLYIQTTNSLANARDNILFLILKGIPSSNDIGTCFFS